MRFSVALQAFWKALSNRDMAVQIEAALQGRPAALPEPKSDSVPAPPPKPKPEPQNPAVTLLAALQREGRLVDFLQENIDEYTDQMVGAAVRDIHRDCRKALDRFGC